MLLPVQGTPQAQIAWEALRLSGADSLAVRVSRKLRSDELYLTTFASTRLRMELERVPLWRGDHVAVKLLVEDFARYLYLPRLKDSSVLVNAICDGVALLSWSQDSFAFADGFDESTGRYLGLRGGQLVSLDSHSSGLLVKPDVAKRQMDAERPSPQEPLPPGSGATPPGPGPRLAEPAPGPTDPRPSTPKGFHGTVTLDPTRVGRDASMIADAVIAHLAGLVGAKLTVTLEVEAEIPSGAPDQVVRTVTENSRTLKFTSQGFEKE